MKISNSQKTLYNHISKKYLSGTEYKEHRKNMNIIKPLNLEHEKFLFQNKISRNKNISNNTQNKQSTKSLLYPKINSIYKKVAAISPRNYVFHSVYPKEIKLIYKKRKGPCIYKNNMEKTVSIKPEKIIIDMPHSQSTNSLLNKFNTNINRKTDNSDNYFYPKNSINPNNQQINTDFYNDVIFLNEKEFINEAAIMIQSNYRGYIFRIKLCNTLNKIDRIGSIFDILLNAYYNNGKNLWKEFLLILKKQTKLMAEKKFYNEFVVNNENIFEISKKKNVNVFERSLSNDYSKDNCISFNFLQKAKNSCFYLAEQLIQERDELKRELINIITKKNELEIKLKKYENDDIKSKLRNLIIKKIEDSKKNLYFYKFYYKAFSFKDEIEIKINKKYHLKNIFNIVNIKNKEKLTKFFYKFLYNGKIFDSLVNNMNSIITKKILENKDGNYCNSEIKIKKIVNKNNSKKYK